MNKNICLVILDSLGIGYREDAEKYGDVGSNTLKHVIEKSKVDLINLKKMGIGNIQGNEYLSGTNNPSASYGKMKQLSVGKDTTAGHWEYVGVVTEKAFKTYPNGFPEDIVKKIEEFSNRKVLGNKVASGTDIIDEYAREHFDNGGLIIYTSADSVLQIAAHKDIISLQELYKICEYTRNNIMVNENIVGRIIARPFIGDFKEGFKRTSDRKDYSIKPPKKTYLNVIQENNIKVIGIGKIGDIYNYDGISEVIKTKSNMDGVDKTIKCLKENNNSFIFTNLVDFDSEYGHRRDPIGYGKALKEFDNRLSEIIDVLGKEDILIITADHGNDPTYNGTDHTREFVPLLVFSKDIKNCKNLGVRDTFADVGKTILDFFEINNDFLGNSILKEIY